MQNYNCPPDTQVSESSRSNRKYHKHILHLVNTDPHPHTSYARFVEWLNKLMSQGAHYYQEEIAYETVFLVNEGDISKGIMFKSRQWDLIYCQGHHLQRSLASGSLSCTGSLRLLL